MRKLLLFLLLALLPGTAAVAGDSPVSGKVKEMLSGRDPAKELEEANVFLITEAAIDYPEYEQIFRQQLIPFAWKHQDRIPLSDIAWLYRNYSLCLGTQGKTVEEVVAIDSARLLIDRVEGEAATKAIIYENAASAQINSGSIETGHRLFYQALKFYEKAGGYDDRVSACLYQLAVGYLQMLDEEGLAGIIRQMQEHCRRTGGKPVCLYDLYSVKTTYFATLSDRNPADRQLSDSAILYSRKAIAIIETQPDSLRANIIPSWNYFNLARIHFDRDPAAADSVRFYLDKALEVKPESRRFAREVEISVFGLEARMLFTAGQYARAENRMLDVIRLLDEDKEANSLLVERADAYALLAGICEKTGRYREALDYQKLLSETRQTRFGEEKMQALKELEVKYEVEKKETAIRTLEDRNRASRRILWLLSAGLAVLAVAIVLIVAVFRLRRRTLEQKSYESALLAELKQEELERTREEYESRLSSIGKQLEQGTFASGIAQVSGIVGNSALPPEVKEAYLRKLASLDPKEADSTFLPVSGKMTRMDLKYIICFYIGMDARDIAVLFNVEPASVYTVRYRIRKKFPGNPAFRFLT